jgi:hypothetical protein
MARVVSVWHGKVYGGAATAKEQSQGLELKKVEIGMTGHEILLQLISGRI